VGADDRSLAWLASYRDRLRKIGAVGLIVQSDGPEDLRRVQEVAGDLTLAVGSGVTLARQLGIEHYPVLIGPEWIEQ
jgi:integrating conjugative element protein (TIGR03765 family)